MMSVRVQSHHPFRQSLLRRGLIFVCITVLIQCTMLAGLWWLRQGADSYAKQSGRDRDLSTALSEYSYAVIATMSRIDQSLETNYQVAPQTMADLRKVSTWGTTLKNLDAASASDCAIIDRITDQTSALLHAVRECSRIKSGDASHDISLQLSLIRSGEARIIKQLLSINEKPPVDNSKEKALSETCVFVVVAGSVVNVILLLLMGLSFSRSVVSRLAIIVENSIRQACGWELLPELPGDDELSQLDRAFHEMSESWAKSQHKYAALISNAREVLCTLDSGGRITNINDAAMNVLGYPSADLIGKSLLDLVPQDVRSSTAERLSELTDASRDSSFETALLTADERRIDTLWVTTQEGNSLFCVVHDVTEHNLSARRKRELVHMVKHDLKSPLTAIGGFHTMLQEGTGGHLDEEGTRFLDAAHSNCQQMLALINALLDAEKLQAGMLRLDCSELSVQSIFEQATKSVMHLCDAKAVHLKVINVSGTVYADGPRLLQVMINLLSNAIKFTPSGGTITISASSDGDFVEMQVSDTGRGIPAHLLSTIFERYGQAHASDASRGSGLGLTFCKALVELHGGQISVESEPGRGTTFSLRLPSHKQAQVIGTDAAATSEESSTPLRSIGGRKRAYHVEHKTPQDE